VLQNTHPFLMRTCANEVSIKKIFYFYFFINFFSSSYCPVCFSFLRSGGTYEVGKHPKNTMRTNPTLWGVRLIFEGTGGVRNLIPVKTYIEPFLNKKVIYKENLKKPGVYMWTNNVNGKSYIGSSINLTSRFYFYLADSGLSIKRIKEKSTIASALIKYGFSNFTLHIIEYC
uniref:GIY-YIG endonuclease n=1 Tax=Elmerina hispida TaxID=1245649 RepID=UPI003002AD56